MAIKLEKTALARKMVTKTKLVMYLERQIDKGEFEWEFKYESKKGDTAWHPSGDCTPSLHELYLKATEQLEYRPISVGLRKTFMVGHFWHQYLQELTLRAGLADESAIERKGSKGWGPKDTIYKDADEMGWRPYNWASGAGDVAPCVIPNAGEYVVDFKTMGSHDFKRISLPEWCAEKYEAQINIYMDFFDLEKGLIVAINKDSPHDLKEFEFVRNQPLIDAIYSKWHLVSSCLEENVTPPEDEVIELPTTGPM